MRAVLAPAAVAAFLATSTFAFAATQHDIGKIKSYDVKAMTLTLEDGKTYNLPKDLKMPSLKTGEKVDVTWEQTGAKLKASAITIVN